MREKTRALLDYQGRTSRILRGVRMTKQVRIKERRGRWGVVKRHTRIPYEVVRREKSRSCRVDADAFVAS